jgi:serine/threonine-protein kinase
MAAVVDPMPALKSDDANDDHSAVPHDPSQALTPKPDRGWELPPVKGVLAARPAWLPEGYDDASFIGSGGQAEVWRARQVETGRVVCIKRYRALAGHGFYRELTVMLSVHAPNLVELVDVLDTASGQMLVMEYCSGGTLRGRLESTGPLGLRDGVELGLQCLRGLRALQSHNLVHADLKPENIFIARRTGPPLYKLADFGIARTTRQFHHTPRLFSQAYAAPEQVAGFAIPASDIYSLCVIL